MNPRPPKITFSFRVQEHGTDRYFSVKRNVPYFVPVADCYNLGFLKADLKASRFDFQNYTLFLYLQTIEATPLEFEMMKQLKESTDLFAAT